MPIPLLYYFLSILSLIAFYCRRYTHFYQLPEKPPFKVKTLSLFLYYTAFLHTITDCFLLSLVSPFFISRRKNTL